MYALCWIKKVYLLFIQVYEPWLKALYNLFPKDRRSYDVLMVEAMWIHPKDHYSTTRINCIQWDTGEPQKAFGWINVLTGTNSRFFKGTSEWIGTKTSSFILISIKTVEDNRNILKKKKKNIRKLLWPIQLCLSKLAWQ